jgi:hypothetical protein
MRLQHLKQIAGGLSTDDAARAAAKTVIVEEVERLRWRLWNGKAKDAQILDSSNTLFLGAQVADFRIHVQNSHF